MPLFLSLAALTLSLGCSTVDAEGDVWEEYEQIRAEIMELSTQLAEKGGRAPEILAPIRESLKAARDRERSLLCWDRPEIPRPREMFESMGLRVGRHLVDRDHVDAFVSQKTSDGTLTDQDATRLRVILSRAGDEVMNPSSLGASRINQRIAKALRCYGLETATADPVEPSIATPPPPIQTETGLRYFKTCGDAVCRDDGYRGPFDEVPLCRDQTAGAPCRTEGDRCDLANHCNMFLICAETDPATRCPR